MPSVHTRQSSTGEILHLVACTADALPSVTKRDLEQAWEAASAAALAPGRTRHDAQTRRIRFAASRDEPLDLLLADQDAANWASAIDTLADLSTAHGISLCLRMLALVDLMGRANWLAPWFTLTRAGLEFHPALLQAASLSPLTQAGGFAETALRDLLPSGTPQQEVRF